MKSWEGTSAHGSSLRLAGAWLTFFLVALTMRHWENPAQGWLMLAGVSLLFATVYALLYLALCRFSPWTLSLFWLGLPYFAFAFGWLRWYWAIPCAVVWLAALWRTVQVEDTRGSASGWPQIAGLVLVLGWVYLSGAGGHGHQSPDYVLHNGRLMDLINEPWPVNYNRGFWTVNAPRETRLSYLVSYNAYYLPAALFGKAAGYARALEFMHVWTLFGVWLALAWLWHFAGAHRALLSVAALLSFGGWDFMGAVLHAPGAAARFLVQFLWRKMPGSLDTEYLDYWTTDAFRFFLGNYLSNASELYWSPHQIVAGWIWMALLTRACLAHRLKQACFIYALSAFWSPMSLMAGALFPLALVLRRGTDSLRAALSFENAVAGASLLTVFGLYYAGGGAFTNPAGWLWNNTNLGRRWPSLLLFHFCSWGIYAIAVLTGWRRLSADERFWFLTACVTFALLPFCIYGSFNDLLCRGSAPLMFLLLIFLLRRVALACAEPRRPLAGALLLLLVPGTLSSVLHARRSFAHFHEKVAPRSVAEYSGGWRLLGPTDSFFVRYLSRPPKAR